MAVAVLKSAAMVVTAAMIRCVALPKWFRTLYCEVCGDSVMHVTEDGSQLCGSCLVDRRVAYRAQRRSGAVEAVLERCRQGGSLEAQLRKKVRQLERDFEGDVTAADLARDGYYDEFYAEYVGSEFTGPKPRWIEESHRSNKVVVSPVKIRQAYRAEAIYWQVATGDGSGQQCNALREAALEIMLEAREDSEFVADGYRDLVTMYDGTDDRDMGPDVLAWLKRDPSTKAVLNRWNRPDDELEFMDRLREDGRESEWWELMVDFRRRKLDSLLKEYFGLDDYRASRIVLKWEKGASGRWKPAKQMNVVDWVKWSCEQSGSTLGGLQSCTRSIQIKNQLRKRKEAQKLAAKPKLDPDFGTHAYMEA